MKKYMTGFVCLCMVHSVMSTIRASHVESYTINQIGSQWPRLFPGSCYGQAVEICMRVLQDTQHEYDLMTALDLCIGRLVRLSHAVVAMEQTHKILKPYPSEDIRYILGLMSLIAQARQQDIESCPTAQSMITSIESRLETLVPNP